MVPEPGGEPPFEEVGRLDHVVVDAHNPHWHPVHTPMDSPSPPCADGFLTPYQIFDGAFPGEVGRTSFVSRQQAHLGLLT
jgi:hypothetical protein